MISQGNNCVAAAAFIRFQCAQQQQTHILLPSFLPLSLGRVYELIPLPSFLPSFLLPGVERGFRPRAQYTPLLEAFAHGALTHFPTLYRFQNIPHSTYICVSRAAQCDGNSKYLLLPESYSPLFGGCARVDVSLRNGVCDSCWMVGCRRRGSLFWRFYSKKDFIVAASVRVLYASKLIRTISWP